MQKKDPWSINLSSLSFRSDQKTLGKLNIQHSSSDIEFIIQANTTALHRSLWDKKKKKGECGSCFSDSSIGTT